MNENEVLMFRIIHRMTAKSKKELTTDYPEFCPVIRKIIEKAKNKGLLTFAKKKEYMQIFQVETTKSPANEEALFLFLLEFTSTKMIKSLLLEDQGLVQIVKNYLKTPVEQLLGSKKEKALFSLLNEIENPVVSETVSVFLSLTIEEQLEEVLQEKSKMVFILRKHIREGGFSEDQIAQVCLLNEQIIKKTHQDLMPYADFSEVLIKSKRMTEAQQLSFLSSLESAYDGIILASQWGKDAVRDRCRCLSGNTNSETVKNRIRRFV